MDEKQKNPLLEEIRSGIGIGAKALHLAPGGLDEVRRQEVQKILDELKNKMGEIDKIVGELKKREFPGKDSPVLTEKILTEIKVPALDLLK